MATRWQTTNPRVGSPEHLLVSRAVMVGVAGYNPARSRGDSRENTYVWNLVLPGTPRKGYAATLEAAQAAAEAAFADWCKAAGLAPA